MNCPLLGSAGRASHVTKIPPNPLQTRLDAAGLKLSELTPPSPAPHVYQARQTAARSLHVPATGQTLNLCDNDLAKITKDGKNIGRVQIGYDATTRQAYAIKTVHREPAASRDIAHLYDEERLGRQAQSTLAGRALLVTDAHVYLVLPLMAGDARTLRDVTGPGKNAAMLLGMRQVLLDLQRCHALGVAHRDIKPANLLHRGSPSSLRLCDFGLAGATTDTHSRVGTPYHMAPEQYYAREHAVDTHDPVCADMWGVGAAFLDIWASNPFCVPSEQRAAMHANYARWHKRTQSIWRWRIGGKSTRRFAQVFARLPHDVRPLMLQLLHPDPLARPTVAQALQEVERLLAKTRNLTEARAVYQEAAYAMCEGWGALC